MFKDRLKELREKTGISQYQLAEKIFVSRSAVAKWENGNGIPSDVNLEALCNFFNVDEEWLVDRKDMKDMVKELDKKNNKVFLFLVGIIVPLIILLLSLFPIFMRSCGEGEICTAVYTPPTSIFSFLLRYNGIFLAFSLPIYLYTMVFSIFYWKKNTRYGKIVQLVNLCIVIICFVITFVMAYNIALSKGYELFFIK